MNNSAKRENTMKTRNAQRVSIERALFIRGKRRATTLKTTTKLKRNRRDKVK